MRVATPLGAHYLQYSFAPRLRILNGFVQALNGLADFVKLGGDADGRALLAAGLAQAQAEVPTFDTGAWSLYARPGGESSLSYHVLCATSCARCASGSGSPWSSARPPRASRPT